MVKSVDTNDIRTVCIEEIEIWGCQKVCHYFTLGGAA